MRETRVVRNVKNMPTRTLINNPVRWEQLLRKKPEFFWWKRGKKAVISLWKEMAVKIPAYKHTMASQHPHRETVSATMSDFLRLAPVLTKENYLRRFSLDALCWNGSMTADPTIIAATSGSSGKPFYFPRTHEQDLQYAAVAEMYLRSNFSIHKKSTLYIVGWGMGVWIGGVFSYSALRILAERGSYRLSIITPGTSNQEILKAVVGLGGYYDQIIIGGYPPMIKDLIDEGIQKKISWKKYPVKFIFSAEGFTESFRSYIAEKTGLKNPLTDTLNHYGSVDLGTMAHETPIAILIRRLASHNPALNERLFGHPYNQPTLAQFIPELFYFEEHEGALLCSARSGIPLVRYDLLDWGGVHTFASIRKIFSAYGIDLDKEASRAGIAETIWQIPFVYVFERKDFTLKVSGANIYPQEIRRALESPPLRQMVTGKHTAEVYYDSHMNQLWRVHIELRHAVSPTAKASREAQQSIVDTLIRCNSEYANNVTSLGKVRMTPKVQWWPYKSAPYFDAPGKHKWVRKT